MNPSTAFAQVVLDELIAQGIDHVVLSPGSRSGPLALALAAAEAAGQVQLFVRLDERSAGYLAVGLAMSSGSGRPVAVVCTSGTAAVNLHPAVVEASYAGVPLVVVTADRPPALRGVGASQTIEQRELYGGAVRSFVEFAVPVRAVGQVGQWRSTVAEAVRVATGFPPGPVHLNCPLDEPLVPQLRPDGSGDPDWPEPLSSGQADDDSSTRDRPAVRDRRPVRDRVDLAQWCRLFGLPAVPPRGVVVLGRGSDPDGRRDAVALAGRLGWPVLCEPPATPPEDAGDPQAPGQGQVIRHGSLLLGDGGFAAEHRPEFVLTVGTFGLSRATLAFVRTATTHLAVASLGLPADPLRSAAAVLERVPELSGVANGAVDPGWLASWQRAADRTADVVAKLLDGTDGATSPTGLTGPGVVRRVLSQAVSGSIVLVGPSWPLRHAAAFGTVPDGVTVHVNRGVNGIDGLVSTAYGLAAARCRPGAARIHHHAVLGDLSFLHDIGGLLVPATEQVPDLTYVVVDNDGGGIFSQLEQGAPEYAEHFERVFGTPHGKDLAAIARGYGIAASTVLSNGDLEDALAAAAAAGGVHVVVARVPSRDDERNLLRDLQSAVSASLNQ